MAEVWKAEESVVDMMIDLVSRYHTDLVDIVDQIGVVFREKAAKQGGQVILGKASKASPLFGVLGDTPYKFILEIPADEWTNNLNGKQRQALMDHLLCRCRADRDEETDEVKFYIAQPDVSFFWDELDRWGDWRPRPEQEEPGEEPTSIEDIFGMGGKAKAGEA